MATQDLQLLSVSIERETLHVGYSGIVTNGRMSLMIERVDLDSGYFFSRARNVASAQTNWLVDPPGAEVEWGNDEAIDGGVFAHSETIDPQSISILADGDYLLTYNDAFGSDHIRVNPVIAVDINGVAVPGASTRSHYIRNASAHEQASGSLVFYLNDLSTGDVVSVRTSRDVNTGAVYAVEDALLVLEQKSWTGRERLVATVDQLANTSAVFQADVDFNQSVWELTWFWGTSDGGMNPGAWEITTESGWYTDVVSRISTPITGLIPLTRYDAVARATNCATQVWSTVLSFETPGGDDAPVISNGPGAVGSVGAADLFWRLHSGEVARVSMFWGTSDGGTNPAAWDHDVSAGLQSEGQESITVTGLIYG
ncbi:MAG: hypothetical protein AAF492_27850, partial [Verrucomicrobiota bacterium]